jgi:hypothetical protein
MSATVHKLLVHGAEIIKSLPLSVELLSEDVIESVYKEYKILRHSRKTSRINTNTNIFNWMLISSDPVVTNTRKDPKNNQTKFHEVVSLHFFLVMMMMMMMIMAMVVIMRRSIIMMRIWM